MCADYRVHRQCLAGGSGRPAPRSGTMFPVLPVAVGVSVGVVLVTIAVIVVICCCRRKNARKPPKNFRASISLNYVNFFARSYAHLYQSWLGGSKAMDSTFGNLGLSLAVIQKSGVQYTPRQWASWNSWYFKSCPEIYSMSWIFCICPEIFEHTCKWCISAPVSY